jgi:hypothetical protein
MKCVIIVILMSKTHLFDAKQLLAISERRKLLTHAASGDNLMRKYCSSVCLHMQQHNITTSSDVIVFDNKLLNPNDVACVCTHSSSSEMTLLLLLTAERGVKSSQQ